MSITLLEGSCLWDNLDIRYIEKNIFDYIFNIVMYVKNKSKDNIKAWKYLLEYCWQQELHLVGKENGNWIKPKTKCVLSPEQRRNILNWMRELCLLNGNSSNFSWKIEGDNEKFIGLKSHDYHTFMEQLVLLVFKNYLTIYKNP